MVPQLVQILLTIPFCLALQAPLSDVDPRTFFAEVKRSGNAAPSQTWAGKSAPLPTNAWWMNFPLVKVPGAQEGNLFQMPYIVLAENAGMNVMQPSKTGSPAMQSFDAGLAVRVGTSGGGLTSPIVQQFDELSLTIGWPDSGQTKGFDIPLMRGSPYITAEFNGSTPQIQALQMLRQNGLKVDGVSYNCDGFTFSGSTISFDLLQSDSTWMVFSPKGVSWTCETSAAMFSLTATTPLTAAIRLALSNDCTTGSGAFHCTGYPKGWDSTAYAAILTKYAGCYPSGATLSYTVDQTSDSGRVDWVYDKVCLDGWDNTLPLLQLAYPVHMPLFSEEVQKTALANPATPFKDLRGTSVLVLGDSWELNYKLFPDVGLRSPRPVSVELKQDILDALKGPSSGLFGSNESDKDFDLPLNYQLGVGDTYFSGKMVARMARNVAIADELGESNEAYFSEMVDRLAQRVEIWFNGSSPNPLLYDSTWGGLIACGCSYDDCGGKCTPHCANPTQPPEACPAMTDAGMNFGNAWYNDHHFHYGYLVYAASVVGKFRPAWEKQWRQRILTMVRDYANPSTADTFFPVTRQKDWFLGFSWASGIAGAWVLGRNQESSSEAINSYYAIYTFGVAVSADDAMLGKQLMDLGRILLAMETHSADVYWHVRPNSELYPGYPYKTVGILWTNQAEHQTWFGTTPYIVGGIELLPVIPASEQFLFPDWVSYHIDDFLKSCRADAACQTSGWAWTPCLELAVVDISRAKACLKALPEGSLSTQSAAGNGNSLTNSYYWLATRPQETARKDLIL